jgi:tetratricopeptide (TPR) repeat protein
MNLTDSSLKELENPSLTHNERILVRCRLASEFIHNGQYETAREALGEMWQGVGKRPGLERLKPHVVAEVLLQCGTLSGWLGGAQHVAGAQERAKDLLFESLRIFRSQDRNAKVSEAKYELSKCYFRLGAYDEARVILKQAIDGLEETETDLRAKVYIREAVFEIWTGRYHDAFGVLEKARAFFEASGDALKGMWHGQRALVLRRLSAAERRLDLADRAIIEYTAAIFHYEEAGHERYCGSNLNNLAFLLYKLGRYGEAHERLDRAIEIFDRHKDTGNLAQVNETRARVLVAEGHYKEADHLLSDVIETFTKGSEYGRLTDALTVQGVARARLGLPESSLQILRYAMSMAQNSGAYSNAGLASLTLIEEHGEERLSVTELFDVYNRADDLLKDTQDAEEIARLRSCSRLVMRRLLGMRSSDNRFTLPRAMHDCEARLIREALDATQGIVSHAAKRLGVPHQTLVHALNTRHQDLLSFRTPAQRRRKSLMRQKSIANKRKTKDQ